MYKQRQEFQSTLSLRRATTGCRAGRVHGLISIHALLAESDLERRQYDRELANFNPRSPCGERRTDISGYLAESDFNPRSPCGERLSGRLRSWFCLQFQSTLSLRRATISFRAFVQRVSFQSTLSLRRATSGSGLLLLFDNNFNPRSPCGERLRTAFGPCSGLSNFNPRSPCGERPRKRKRLAHHIDQFQSTLSLRRATSNSSSVSWIQRYFNPRSPCGERQAPLPGQFLFPWISIHALLAESDWSYRGTTYIDGSISIHALLAESDPAIHGDLPGLGRFQSTLSLRRATMGDDDLLVVSQFQSTLSLRRATR